uniref:Uncharacterized protein n=1 Tax=Rhizophora mucronata TaxID=61149 RepID=A0A2P2NCW9_RHIMU
MYLMITSTFWHRTYMYIFCFRKITAYNENVWGKTSASFKKCLSLMS